MTTAERGWGRRRHRPWLALCPRFTGQKNSKAATLQKTAHGRRSIQSNSPSDPVSKCGSTSKPKRGATQETGKCAWVGNRQLTGSQAHAQIITRKALRGMVDFMLSRISNRFQSLHQMSEGIPDSHHAQAAARGALKVRPHFTSVANTLMEYVGLSVNWLLYEALMVKTPSTTPYRAWLAREASK